MKECFVYMIGHNHATFGTAVKVGIAANVGARLAALQTANIEDLQLFYAMRFDSRDIALQVERLFHESELAGKVRGEWYGVSPIEALFYLTILAARVLSSRYSRDEIADARRRSGLVDLMDIAASASDEDQSDWNERIAIFDEHIEERGYL